MADCCLPFIIDWIQYLAPIQFLVQANKKVYDGNVDIKRRKKYEEHEEKKKFTTRQQKQPLQELQESQVHEKHNKKLFSSRESAESSLSMLQNPSSSSQQPMGIYIFSWRMCTV